MVLGELCGGCLGTPVVGRVVFENKSSSKSMLVALVLGRFPPSKSTLARPPCGPKIDLSPNNGSRISSFAEESILKLSKSLTILLEGSATASSASSVSLSSDFQSKSAKKDDLGASGSCFN